MVGSCVLLARSASDVPLKTLVARTAEQVARYETELSYLIADETYEQHVQRAGRSENRLMHGELFLTYLTAERHWIAVHDVSDVDGQPVTDRQSLQDLLSRASVDDVVRGLVARNARYNIGATFRNFNEPTLPLAIFERDELDRFSFSQGDETTEAGAALITLHFKERERPTLVRDVNGQPAYSTGDITIERDSGVIRHTRIVINDKRVESTLETRYSHDSKLDLWLPTTFTERYVSGSGPLTEVTTCEATYTNYRRFDVSARILPAE
jgi:hypothetical protein